MFCFAFVIVSRGRLCLPPFFYLYMELFYGNVTQESLEFLNQRNVFTQFFDKYKDISFPDMIESSDEIEQIISIQKKARGKENWSKIEKYILLIDGDMYDIFKVYLKKLNIPFDQAYIDKLVNISNALGCLLMDLKNHYQRPRPFQLAYYTNQKLHPMTTMSGQTPAFPSGHACQGRFLTKVITQDFPTKRVELTKLSEQMSKSRIIMGVHYPSDNVFGEKIACELWKEKSIQNYLDSFE